jgi:hypothetical protein
MSLLDRNLNYNPKANTTEDPEHIYIDMEVVNNSSNFEPQPIIFQQTQFSNVLDKSNDYYMSIIKWSFNANIPVIIPKMELGTTPTITHTNGTTYYLNCGYGETAETAVFVNTDAEQVIFTPENLYIPEPAYKPYTQDQIFNNQYYYIYTVDNFLEMVNRALELAFNKVKTTYSLGATAVPPRFKWDSSTNCICLLTSKFNVLGLDTNTVFISFNTDLFNLFDTFPAYSLGYNTTPIYGNNFIFNVINNYGLNSISYTPDGGTSFLTIYNTIQQSSSVPSWSPVDNILFTTNSIPINPELSGGANYLGELLKSSQSIQNVLNIMTDFVVPLTTGVEYSKALLYYVPTSEYRLIDLLGNNSLNRLTMQVYWKDKLGFYHYITLKQGANATVKCLFRKKIFNGV